MRAPMTQSAPRLALATALAAALALAAAACAAPALDRNVEPKAGPAPAFTVPTWTTSKLACGADLMVASKHGLPLVSVSIAFAGGAAQFEPADRTGLANFTAQMLSEGTATRTADQIAEAQQMLGTTLRVSVNDESGAIGFDALADRMEPALALVADMLLHPAFPAPALERIRGRALVALQQSRDQPNAIAANVFAHVVYGDAHPYGRIATEASLKSITLDDVVTFHREYFRPGRATVIVAGDVDPAAVKAALDKALAGWTAGGTRPDWKYPSVPAAAPTTIYLVDKPGAPQAVFAIGQAGPPRDTPDYYALTLMNTILGGLFQSRLNHDIREVHGWSYGVNSGFRFGHGPGAFRAGGGVIAAKADSALVEFMTHLRGVQGAIPFTDGELGEGRESMVQSLPRTFSSVGGTNGALQQMALQGLPATYYRDYPAKVKALTAADLVRVAKTHLDLAHLDIVIVGDRSVLESPLRATNIAPVVVLDTDGRPVADKPAAPAAVPGAGGGK